MEHRNISLIDVVESFLTGFSCLVGGDQLYLFISQTNASPKTQYYLSYYLIITTLMIAFVFYDEYYPEVANGFHVIYSISILFLVMILHNGIKSAAIVTLCTMFMSIVLTIFVLFSCINYSSDKYLLSIFVIGMLASRLLPNFCWLFTKERCHGDFDIRSFAIRVESTKLVLSIVSLMIKIANKKFNFWFRFKIEKHGEYDLVVIRSKGFVGMFKLILKTFNLSLVPYSESLSSISDFSTKIPLIIFPFISFYLSLFLFLSLPPVIHTPMDREIHFNYSNQIVSSLSITEMIFHLFGCLLGISYPASNTANSSTFYLFNLFTFCAYTIVYTFITFLGRLYSDLLLHYIVICTSLLLGYLFSYSLMIIINTTVGQTCIHDERGSLGPCPCSEIINKCYCKVSKIIETKYRSIFRYECSKSRGEGKTFLYSSKATCAVLILHYLADDLKDICEKFKQTNCHTTCTGGTCKCLKLLGIYRIDSVTGTSCSDCQLTVRLEGQKTCCCNEICPGSGGSNNCVCGGSNGCCLCIGCCKSSPCTPECNCVKLCCCKSCGSSCNCKTKNMAVRLFMAYKRCDGTCCIREIKPNEETDYVPDLSNQYEFYIRSIFFSDCCHVDLQIHLHCYMKNNFYRLGSINYPTKYLRPVEFVLNKKSSECCNCQKPAQCCCCSIPLVKICVMYEYSTKCCYCCEGECKKPCVCQCICCQKKQKCCCCVSTRLDNCQLTSFNKRIYHVRVKLITILWLVFVILCSISSSVVIKTKNKRLKFYDLNFIKDLEPINKNAKSLKINSPQNIYDRINKSNISSDKMKVDLDNMLSMFEKVLDNKPFNQLNKQMTKESNKLFNKQNHLNKINVEIVMWSYCVGLMYSYVVQMFLILQEYFVRWEYVWRREYFNYRSTINEVINTITNKSKCGIAMISELNLKEKIPYLVTRDRTESLNSTFDELQKYIDVYDYEQKSNQSIPTNIDKRLQYFIDRWDPRIDTIKYLVSNKSNLFTWHQLLDDYPKINQWKDTFYPYLQRAANEISVPEKTLNNKIEVFEVK